MASELSSNWKKLQAKFKAESASKLTSKRKSSTSDEIPGSHIAPHSNKRCKLDTKTLPQKLGKRGKKSVAKADAGSKMGIAQSSKVEDTARFGQPPSLALWAEDNDISPEDIAQAYGLGVKDNSMLDTTSCRPNQGLVPGVEVGKYLAMDCEMVGVGDGGYESALARVSIVDFHGRLVYDSYVRPKERVTDWRTWVSGVGPRNMATARTFDEVQTQVAGLLGGRILVGHDVKHDLQALALGHPKHSVRDTARFSGFRKYGHGPKPALRVLAREILGVEIQTGQHSSIEDAKVAMLLFRRFKPGFDIENASRFPESSAQAGKSKKKPSVSKKKRKH